MPNREDNPVEARKKPDFDYVSPEELDFDETNPRFGGEGKKLSQEEIQKVLEEAPHHALELVDSFTENGFIPYEPLVVRKSGSKYVVIEGNRRLAAVKYVLANPSKYPRAVGKLKKIPVLAFLEGPGASNREDTRTYLGVRHLLGFREWPPESKAIFLDQHIKSATDLRRIAREFSLKRNVIARYVVPYRVKRAAADILDKIEDIQDRDFWVLGEALQRSDIRSYIKLRTDPDTLRVLDFDKTKFRYLLEFLYGTVDEGRRGGYRAVAGPRISETRQLSRLARVLSSKKAGEKLEKGSTLEDAELYVETREETIQALIDDLRVLLQRIILLQPSAEEIEKVSGHLSAFQKAAAGFPNHA